MICALERVAFALVRNVAKAVSRRFDRVCRRLRLDIRLQVNRSSYKWISRSHSGRLAQMPAKSLVGRSHVTSRRQNKGRLATEHANVHTPGRRSRSSSETRAKPPRIAVTTSSRRNSEKNSRSAADDSLRRSSVSRENDSKRNRRRSGTRLSWPGTSPSLRSPSLGIRVGRNAMSARVGARGERFIRNPFLRTNYRIRVG